MKIYDLLKNEKYKDKKLIEKIICILKDIKKEELPNYFENIISDEVLENIDKIYYEVFVDKKPLEYALGFVEFKGKRYKVNENTIIPRQETNFMIKAVEDYLQIEKEKVILLDIGAGCGVLALAVLADYQKKIEKLILTDISAGALKVAEENAEIHLKDFNKIQFIISDLLIDVPKDIFDKKVLLVANLPYIPDEVFKENAESSTKRYEPSLAFLGGKDGLDLYKKMFDQIIKIKSKNIVMFLEMMDNQIKILEKKYPTFKFEVVEYFNFGIRIVKVYPISN